MQEILEVFLSYLLTYECFFVAFSISLLKPLETCSRLGAHTLKAEATLFTQRRLTRTWQKNKAWLRGKFNWIYRRWYSITFSCLSCEYKPPSQLVVWDLSFTYRQAYLNQYHTMAVLFGINIWSDGVQLWNALESWPADKIKNDNNNSLKNVNFTLLTS